jgi:hypothetical protein
VDEVPGSEKTARNPWAPISEFVRVLLGALVLVLVEDAGERSRKEAAYQSAYLLVLPRALLGPPGSVPPDHLNSSDDVLRDGLLLECKAKRIVDTNHRSTPPTYTCNLAL